MTLCCIKGCSNEAFIICDEHNAFSEQNKDKSMYNGDVDFYYGDTKIEPIYVDYNNSPSDSQEKKL